MAQGLKVAGLNQLVRDLQLLGVELADIKKAFSEIADEAAKLAQGFAPKKSGRLAATIRGNKAKNKAVVSAGKASVPYSGPINYGWAARNIEPSHFMQKADKAISPRLVPMLSNRIDALIRAKGLS